MFALRRKREEIPASTEIPLQCPRCFKNVNKNECIYECQNPDCEAHEKENGHKFVNPDGKCDVCGEVSSLRLCPSCSCTLIDRNYGDRLLVIIGPQSSGKTSLICSAIRGLSLSSGINGFSVSDMSTQDLYLRSSYRRMFEQYRKVTPFAKDVSENSFAPITFISINSSTDCGKRPRRLFLSECQFSQDPEYSAWVGKEVRSADGIILTVDPERIPSINENLDIENKLEADPRELDVVKDLCRMIGKRPCNIPLAIVFTKVDVLLNEPGSRNSHLPFLGPSSYVHIPEYTDAGDDIMRQIDMEMRSYLSVFMGKETLDLIERNYDDNAVFAVSALGCNPLGNCLPRIAPIRVTDPFRWMFRVWKWQ